MTSLSGETVVNRSKYVCGWVLAAASFLGVSGCADKLPGPVPVASVPPLPASVNFTFVAQFHVLEGIFEGGTMPDGEKIRDQTLQSQIFILETLLTARDHEPIQVFDEGLSLILTPQERERIRNRLPELASVEPSKVREHAIRFGVDEMTLGAVYFADKVFSNRLPSRDVSQWTKLQRLILMGTGAARLLWALGEIETLYPAEQAETHEKAVALYREIGLSPTTERDKRRFRQIIEIDREKAALMNLAIYGIPGAKKYLVIGRDHDFAPYLVSPKVRFDRLKTSDETK